MSGTASPSVLLVGGGNMGAAMLGGWLAAGRPAASFTVLDPTVGPALKPILDAWPVTHRDTPPAEPVDVLVLAVKPQMMGAVLPDLRAAVGPGTLVVSIAAGTTIDTIRQGLGARAVVRAMPNTPALIGRGVTGAFANEHVTPEQRQETDDLLGASGPVEWVGREPLIDAVTAVSGSGPAYVFLLAEALAAAGEAVGLEPDLAMRLARHTVAGAGEMMIRSSDAPEQLRRNVTSPNGTTAAALAVLMAESGGLPELMNRAVEAARARAAELSKD
ncbi:pyrroline-5-carboxylate reductase [Antarcticirhabdus aurantiaca]|nr:pyrroline-5-carboxylate reductase [Antarcticirhabdus aurantiaca]